MIVITKEAAKVIAEQQSTKYLRVSAVGGGCSGLQYKLDFTDNKEDSDVATEQHGITIIMDKKSNIYLNDVTIDFSNSLNDSGFKFVNDKAKRVCGCGNSFSY